MPPTGIVYLTLLILEASFMQTQILKSTYLASIKLVDPNNTYLIDGFPLYFTCSFRGLGKNMTIRFRRTNNQTLLKNTFFTYESVQHDYQADSTLYKLKNHSKSLLNNGDLTSVFEINLNMYWTRQNMFIWIGSNQSRPVVYNLIQHDLKPRRSKRLVNNHVKYSLNVEACVHVDYDVYKSLKVFLNTMNMDQINMLMSISHLVV